MPIYGGQEKWGGVGITWDDPEGYLSLWSDVREILEAGRDRRARDDDEEFEKKKRRVIRLIMKRKGIKIYDERKEVKNIEIHLDDIKLIAEEMKANVQIIHG